MRPTLVAAGSKVALALLTGQPQAQMVFWSVQAEQVEYRIGEGGEDVAAWHVDAYAGKDELKVRLISKGEYLFEDTAFEKLDNQLRAQAPQCIEVDADLFISDEPIIGIDAEYEGLITNRLILTPNIEIELPLTDDAAQDNGAFGPRIEVGAHLSYDLVDRLVSPYIGVPPRAGLRRDGRPSPCRRR